MGEGLVNMAVEQEKMDDLESAKVALELAALLVHEEPTVELLTSLVEADVFAEAPYGQDNANVANGLALMGAWAAGAKEQDPTLSAACREVHDDWLKLLVGLGQPLAPCWESFYTTADRRLFAANSVDLKHEFAQFGAQLTTRDNEPVDHLGIILQFVAFLVGLESSFSADGDAEHAAAAREAQGRVLEGHVLGWLPEWYGRMKNGAGTGFYDGLADLLFGIVQTHAEKFGLKYYRTSNEFRR